MHALVARFQDTVVIELYGYMVVVMSVLVFSFAFFFFLIINGQL